MQRILLIEFAVAGRYHRAVQFPYLAGLLEASGVPWWWLRFGVAPDQAREQDGAGLGPEDLALLCQVASHFAPTRVVLSRIPAERLTEEIVSSVFVDPVHVLGDTTATTSLPARVLRLGSEPQAWCDLAGIVHHARNSRQSLPHFGYHPANEAARKLPPLPFLVFGAECTYERPLTANPFYRDIDLSHCVRREGCAFCNRPSLDRSAPGFSPDDARRQLMALRRTLPDYAGRLTVRLMGEKAIEHVEALATILRDLDFPAADWLLDSRADRLASRETSLARACEILSGTGHQLHIALVGIESFIRADLERMNKGVDPLTNLDAVLVLLRLELDHDNFSFRRFGGLSTIFFTPWTTLDDLALNLRVVQQCGLANVAGKVLADRLRLEPSLPITALAQRDGLLIEGYDDTELDTASRNFYGAETPWRFRDRRVEVLSRVFVRLHGAASQTPVEDALGQRVASLWQRAAARRYAPIDLALRLIDRVQAMQPAAGAAIPAPDELVEDLERAFDAEAREPASTPQSDWELGSGSDEPSFGVARQLVELCRAGIKPVSKIESLTPQQADAFLRQVAPPHARIRSLQDGTGARSSQVFFGATSQQVEAAMRWGAQGEDDPDDRHRDQAVAEAGKALGYPTCCAEAFAHGETPRSRLSYAWLHLHRRVACPGSVDPLLNPWAVGLLEGYVPCSLRCEASLGLLRRAAEVLRRGQGSGAAASMLEKASNPWLVVLEGQGHALELIPLSVPGPSFRFRAGQRVGASALLQRAASADTLELDAERLVLKRGPNAVLDLSLRAFVWWYRQAFQVDLWSRVISLRTFLGRDHHAAGRPALDIDGGLRVGKRLLALQRLLSTAVADLKDSGRLQGIRIEHLRPASAAMLSLELAVGDERLSLYVAEASESAKPSTRAGPFSLMRPPDQDLRSPVLRAAVQALVAQLRVWVGARQRERAARASRRP